MPGMSIARTMKLALSLFFSTAIVWLLYVATMGLYGTWIRFVAMARFHDWVALLILVLGSWYLVLAGAIALGVQGRKMMEIGTKGMTAKGEHYLIVSRPIWTGLMNGNPRNLDQKDWEVLMGRRQSSQSTRGPIEMGMVGRTAHGTECIAVPFEVWEDLMPDKFFEVRPEEVKALLAATY